MGAREIGERILELGDDPLDGAEHDGVVVGKLELSRMAVAR